MHPSSQWEGVACTGVSFLPLLDPPLFLQPMGGGGGDYGDKVEIVWDLPILKWRLLCLSLLTEHGRDNIN